jgi:diacylglycerol O-acyltransferase / wax synthase
VSELSRRGTEGVPESVAGDRPLTREDLAILELENDLVAGHACKVVRLDDAIDVQRLRTAIGERLPAAPRLSLRLSEVNGEPWWIADPGMDVAEHVVEAPGQRNESDFLAAVARIFAQHLDRSRPLWRIDLIPRVGDGGSALIWRIHHALADGITMMRMAGTVLWDEEPAARAAAVANHRPAPAAGRPARRRFGGLRGAAREAPQPWMRSPFDGRIGGQRSVALVSLELQEIKSIAHAAAGATVNDVVLALVAGGLRRWIEAHHGRLGAVRVKVPVSLHNMHAEPAAGELEPGNRDSFFCLDLPLGSAEPLDRLAAIRNATKIRKQEHDAQHLDALMRRLARTPRLSHFAERVLAHPRSFALNVSNVPGPRRPVRVLGTPVTGMYTLAEIREHHALRLAVVSLADTLNFGFVADPSIVADVDHLARDVQAEARALLGR